MPRDVDWVRAHSFQLVVLPTPSPTSLAKGDLLLAEVQGPVAPATLMSCKVQCCSWLGGICTEAAPCNKACFVADVSLQVLSAAQC